MKIKVIIAFVLVSACKEESEKSEQNFDENFIVLRCEDEMDKRGEGWGHTLRFSRIIGPTRMDYFTNDGYWANACESSQCSGFSNPRSFEYSISTGPHTTLTEIDRTTGRWTRTAYVEGNVIPPRVISEGDCYEIEKPIESKAKF